MPKFAHIADTHIKNLKYHYEYKKVFQQLYQILKEESVDYIIHCGDIAHTKTQISPEFVELASDFFRNLSSIAPTYIILGNHDGNLKNSSRQDAITPIIDALDLDNLYLLKDSGETEIGDGVTLNVLSVFDRDNWVSPTRKDDINIALFHGSISGVKTDTGYVMEHGECPIDVFDGHDYAFLGDIHKTNQILDEEGRIRYCGSTVQQNHGETNDKGFLIWDIKDKDDFSVDHHILKNPKPFVSIYLTPKGRIPKGLELDKGARLRLVSENNLSLDRMRKAVDVAKRRFRPETITFLNRAAGDRGGVDLDDSFSQEDLRDITVQEKLIKEYLTDYEIDTDTLERVFALNRKYNSAVSEEDDSKRNIKWSLKGLSYDNLFNYGDGNKIDFESLQGVVGIFGKNFSGKSSIIDSLVWTMFNSTSKNNRKNLNVINQTKEDCEGKVAIDISGKEYIIHRKASKYIKRLKGEETVEAKTDLDFYMHDPATGYDEPLNGLTRSDTDKNIRKYFGTLDDFLLTSMASQLGSLSFIGEGSTRRKEILAKFLDLEMFDKKFKLAKEDSSEIKALINKMNDIDYDELIKEQRQLLALSEIEIDQNRRECSLIKENLTATEEKISEIKEKIASVPVEIIDFEEETALLKKAKESKAESKKEGKNTREALKNLESDIKKIESFVETFDIDEYKQKKEIVKSKKEELNTIYNDMMSRQRQVENHKKKLELLQGIPCGTQYSSCKFIKDAYTSQAAIPNAEADYENVKKVHTSVSNEIEELNPEQIEEYINKYSMVVEKLNNNKSIKSDYLLSLEKNKSALLAFESQIEEHKSKIAEYEANREAIENLGKLNKELKSLNKTQSDHSDKLTVCENNILELYKKHGAYEQKITSITEQEEEYKNLNADFSAYDLFMRCMHSNGIALDIVRRSLPVLNQEIAKVLANIVEFEVIMECDDKNLNILIKHPKYDARPLEMGSGAEKTIASMSIRLALLNVTAMPKGDVFILDEPGTALDEDNMEGFIRILDLVKSYYKTVLLISHLDSLKDCVDQQICIDKKDGMAYVNH
jgi:DNA repair exonuclease SbcCD ATPase subunit/DNA repair exonuclease SbcCD nuclease subunit